MNKTLRNIILVSSGLTACSHNTNINCDPTITEYVPSGIGEFSFIPENADLAKSYGFNPLHKSFQDAEIIKVNQEGYDESMKDIIQRGVNHPASKKYITGILEKSIDDYSGEPAISLAKKTVYLLWKDISVNAGKGIATNEMERGRMNLEWDPVLKYKIWRESNRKDSKQSLDEFISQPSSPKRYRGDCDDFSIALITGYGIMRFQAEKNRDENLFWETLDTGLQRFKVIGLRLKGEKSNHMINAFLSYNDDYSKCTVEPFEPQCYSEIASACSRVYEEELLIDNKTLKYHRIWINGDMKLEKERKIIDQLYNSHSNYTFGE